MMAIMRRTLVASGLILAAGVGITASVAHASTPRHVATAATVAPRVHFDAAFTALAATLPICRPEAVTNCRTGTAAHMEASVQSKTATIYFEMRNGVVTDLEVYPIAR